MEMLMLAGRLVMIITRLMFATVIVHGQQPAIPPDPVGNFDFPDPAAMQHDDGTFFAFGGSIMMSSPDLATWTPTRNYLAVSPPWARKGDMGGAPCAPVSLRNRTYVMSFQAEQRNCSRQICTCIGVAFADHPAGPFTPAATPMTCMPGHNGAIDSSIRRLDSDVLAMYWKSTGYNTLARPAQLWAAKLTEDGSALASSPINLVNQTAQWEAHDGIGCIEAPSLLQYEGRTRLFYSGGDWTAGMGGLPYSIGYADCDSPFGPCHKVTTAEPWFGPTYNQTVGPGGQEVFLVGKEKQPWMVFHGWHIGQAGYENGGRRAVRFYPLATLPELQAISYSLTQG